MKRNLSRYRALPFAALAALSLSGFAAAQEAAEAAAQTLPAARTVIDRFVEATNAKAVYDSSSLTHTVGKFSMPAMGMEGKMEAWSAKPDLSLAEITMGGMGTVLEGFNGDVAWSMHPMMGAQIKKGIEHLQAKMNSQYGGAMKDPALYESIETVGREKFEGKECYKLEVVAKALDGMDAAKTKKARTTHEFYEVESGLLMGMKGTAASQMGEMPMTTVMSDYKKFGEGMVATKTVTKMAMGEFEITVESVEYSKEFDAAKFALPKEIKAQADKMAEKMGDKKAVGVGSEN